MADPNDDIEQTVMFVDLVSFTALTDVHGDLVGADVSQALQGLASTTASDGLRYVKSAGDGVLMVATEPAAALRGVGELIEAVHDMGLEARAGMAHGAVVSRDGDIYGSTVNLASRLTAVARPGTAAVTRAVALAAADADDVVEPLGPTVIRGVRDPVETFLVDPCRHDTAASLDPVCGMRLVADTPTGGPHRIDGHVFCSDTCADIYAADPARYTPDLS